MDKENLDSNKENLDLNSVKGFALSQRGKSILVVLLVIALAAIIILLIPKKNKVDTDMDANLAENNLVTENMSGEPNIENIGESEKEVEIVEDEFPTDRMVDLAGDDFGRVNPFLPPVSNVSKSKYDANLMAPPEIITEDTEATDIIKTKVTGIMYDNKKPTAILNIDDSDFLVHVGDTVRDYQVLSITKDMVMVKLGSNVYKASVGSLFDSTTLTHNEVYDLKHKFGGSKK